MSGENAREALYGFVEWGLPQGDGKPMAPRDKKPREGGKRMSESSSAERPGYYRQADGKETWDTIRGMLGEDGYEQWLVGTVVKYLARYRRKRPENPVEDLLKADTYLRKLIELVSHGSEDGRSMTLAVDDGLVRLRDDLKDAVETMDAIGVPDERDAERRARTVLTLSGDIESLDMLFKSQGKETGMNGIKRLTPPSAGSIMDGVNTGTDNVGDALVAQEAVRKVRDDVRDGRTVTVTMPESVWRLLSPALRTDAQVAAEHRGSDAGQECADEICAALMLDTDDDWR